MSRFTAARRILREKAFANPLATILSAAMMLRYSINLPELADAVEKAV
jgi:3-isopropylmalate dehydrogenase